MEDVLRRNEEDRHSHDTARLVAAGLHRVPTGDRPQLLVVGARAALAVDTRIFSLEAVLRAAYKFTDRSYVFLDYDVGRPELLYAVLSGKSREQPLEALVGEFANELIDQRLREALNREFADLRTLIVAEAFADTNLLDVDREDGNYLADPRGAGRRR